uniref:Uncharacterized protein LOC102803451 n=1 Tax=Saccoglossus kowalevskii TaxID=10224 RepID=A0ABM0MBW2_SACKO|nr:PREDICTED: uncharacterized protein LOC102803451 [Saccoglossus kowalevskii]
MSLQTNMGMPGSSEIAVLCEDVHKSYVKSSPVLHGIDLTLPQGAIYGLLGPSGCGKTTLLRCMLARLNNEKGNILVLGQKPGTTGHGVPGKLVGYMPQINDRIQFLLEFLNLPPKSTIIGHLRIWQHLIELTKSGNVTIIITTHYIEEARQADIVGLMRNGHILAESPPQQLISHHNLETLEAVFLKLCQQDYKVNEDDGVDSSLEPVSVTYKKMKPLHRDYEDPDENTALLGHRDSVKVKSKSGCCQKFNAYCPSIWNVLAIFIKDLIRFKRRPGYMLGMKVDNETIVGSTILVSLDMTNVQIAVTLQQEIMTAFQDFANNISLSLVGNTYLAQLPIVFTEPIYGNADSSFTDFMAPGVILSITFFLAVGLTALTLIIERKEGLLDRSWVAGVNAAELMLAHLMTQFIIMMMQIVLELAFILGVFKVPCEGSILLVLILTLMQGFCGMSYGLLISACIDDENAAVQVSLGSFYPNLLLSGIIWPVEAIPYPLRYLSYALPQTFATEAMRCIMFRACGDDGCIGDDDDDDDDNDVMVVVVVMM